MSKKDFSIASLSALVQYYEYHLFGFLAAIIGKNFFLDVSPSTRLLKTYVIMFIAVCAKPIGALLLGRIGDVYGRQKAINIAIALTAAASFVIAILPAYETIGVASALILLLMRMCIASCASSGSDGVRLYIYEKIDSRRKNLGSGMTTLSTVGGSFVASISAWFFTLGTFPAYSWRFAFLAGSIAGLLITMLRNCVDISQDNALKQESSYEHYKNMPLFTIVRQNLQVFTLCVIVAGGIGASYAFNFIFLVNFNFEVLQNIDASSMQYYRSVGIILYMTFAIVGGWVADCTSAILTSSFAIIGIILVSGINCYLLAHGTLSIPIYLTICALLPFVTMPALTLLQSSIPKVIRYRLFSLSHGVGAMIISAPTAGIASILYELKKVSWIPNAYFMFIMFCMLIAMIKLFGLRQNSQSQIN